MTWMLGLEMDYIIIIKLFLFNVDEKALNWLKSLASSVVIG
jgi:hypothetical protein